MAQTALSAVLPAHESAASSTSEQYGPVHIVAPKADSNLTDDLTNLRINYAFSSLPYHPETLFMGMINTMRHLAYEDFTSLLQGTQTFAPPAAYLFSTLTYTDAGLLGEKASRVKHLVAALELMAQDFTKETAFSGVSFELLLEEVVIGRGKIFFNSRASSDALGPTHNATNEVHVNVSDDKTGEISPAANVTGDQGLSPERHMTYFKQRIPDAMPISEVSTLSVFVYALAQEARRPFAGRIEPTLFAAPGSETVVRVSAGANHFPQVLLAYGLTGGLWYAALEMYKRSIWEPMRVEMYRDGRRAGYLDVLNLHETRLLPADDARPDAIF